MTTHRLVAAAVLTALLAAGCTSTGGRDLAGSPEVFERISRTTDCTQLEREFDQAAANQDRDLDRGAVDLARISTEYIAAADERMREVGCYRYP